MAKPKRDWAWRRLLGMPADETKPRRKANYANFRKPDFMTNAEGRTVRYHVPHPVTPANERFIALTERVLVNDEYCVIWRGGDTFRVDDDRITTPARFYWEIMAGEKLGAHEVLYRTCKTARCIKHREKR